MKSVLLVAILMSSINASADVIVSLAAKNGTRAKETTNTSTTTPIVDSKGKVVGYSTNTSQHEAKQTGTDIGVLVQAMPNDGMLSVGVGYFQDGTGLVTLGLRFK